MVGGETADLSPFQHPRFARMYEQMSAESEQRGTAEHRDRALAGLAGRVIEVGAGDGRKTQQVGDLTSPYRGHRGEAT
jgi:hypothetical protein